MDLRSRLATLGKEAQRRLFLVLGLRAGEGRRTALASAYHLGFVAAVVLIKSASNALVVARFHAQALPPLYIASALATGLVAWIAVLLQRRGQPRRIPRRGLIGASIALGVLTVASEHGTPWAVLGLYVYGESFATLVSIRFWGGVSELFDPRESRRIFGILGGAGMAGAIVAGSLAQLLGERVGAVGLLPMAMGSLLATASVGQALYRRVRFDPRAESIELPGEDAARQARAYIRQNPLARQTAILMLLLASLTALADYVFRARAGAVLDEGEMASLFGALNLWMGVIAVVFQITAAGRVLERWGVFRYLAVTPALTGLFALVCLGRPGLGPAFALRLVESAGSLSLNPSAFQLLYGPMPDSIRSPVRSFIDGLVKKVGFALGGLLLVWAGTRFDESILLGGIVALVLAIVFVLRRARRAYLETIEERLSRAVVQGRRSLQAENRKAFERELAREEAERILIALAFLRTDPLFDPAPHLPQLLRHGDPRVRRTAIHLARERKVDGVAGRLAEMVAEDDAEVAYEAALALGALAPGQAREVLGPLLDEPDHPLAGAAIAALLPLEGEEGPAARALRARLEAADATAEQRRETVRALGKLGASPYAAHIERYLNDLDPAVRAEACRAAGETKDLALLSTLAGLLSDRAVRVHARRALAAYGDAAVPLLAQWLDDRSLPLSLRLEIPRVLRSIGTEDASRAMLFSNIVDHAYLRYRIGIQLSKLHQEHPEVPVDRKRLREATFRRVRDYDYYLRVYRDLEAALPPGSPLVRALGDRLGQNLELVFRLLQIRFADMPIVAAWRAFATGGPRDRAYCIELLESVLDPAFRDAVVPLLEAYHRLPPPEDGPYRPDPRRGPARIMELAVSDDVELAAIARQTARLVWPEHPPIPAAAEETEMDPKIIERVFLFEGVDAFEESNVDDLVALAQISREERYRRGDVIYREGDEAGALYVVIEGRVVCTRGGREVLRVEKRDTFGQTSVLDGGRRPVTAVVASDEARVLAIDRHDLLALIADRPELLRGIFNAVTRHLRDILDGVGVEAQEQHRALERSVG